MNNITVYGRLTRDIDLRYTPSQVVYARFNLASKSLVRGYDGEYGTNFFPCVIWRDKAQRLAKLVKQGDAIIIKGSFNSREYDKNGALQIIWELNVEDFELAGSKDEIEKNSDNTELTPLDDDSCPF